MAGLGAPDVPQVKMAAVPSVAVMSEGAWVKAGATPTGKRKFLKTGTCQIITAREVSPQRWPPLFGRPGGKYKSFPILLSSKACFSFIPGPETSHGDQRKLISISYFKQTL